MRSHHPRFAHHVSSLNRPNLTQPAGPFYPPLSDCPSHPSFRRQRHPPRNGAGLPPRPQTRAVSSTSHSITVPASNNAYHTNVPLDYLEVQPVSQTFYEMALGVKLTRLLPIGAPMAPLIRHWPSLVTWSSFRHLFAEIGREGGQGPRIFCGTPSPGW